MNKEGCMPNSKKSKGNLRWWQLSVHILFLMTIKFLQSLQLLFFSTTL